MNFKYNPDFDFPPKYYISSSHSADCREAGWGQFSWTHLPPTETNL